MMPVIVAAHHVVAHQVIVKEMKNFQKSGKAKQSSLTHIVKQKPLTLNFKVGAYALNRSQKWSLNGLDNHGHYNVIGYALSSEANLVHRNLDKKRAHSVGAYLKGLGVKVCCSKGGGVYDKATVTVRVGRC